MGAKKIVLTANKAAVGTINDITKSEKIRGFPDKNAFRIMYWLTHTDPFSNPMLSLTS